MKNEKRSHAEAQRRRGREEERTKGKSIFLRVNKILQFPLFIVLCSLFIGCDNPLSQATTIPAGKGSFSLSVAVARTILPDTPELTEFASFTLAFTAANGGSDHQEDRDSAQLSDPVYLEPGTYNLEVTAYFDTDKTKLAARGSIEGLVINEGESISQEITLRVIIGEGSGTFTYDVSFPAGLATARVTIVQMNNPTSSHEKSFLSGGYDTTAYTETVPLDAGYYDVVFTFEKADGQTLIWRELLHVYPNLESIFDMEFEDGDFYKTQYSVTFVYDDGAAQDLILNDIMHGVTVDRPPNPTNPNTELAFDNWYSNSGLTALFDFKTPITGNTIVYAGWQLANLSSTTGHILGWIPAGTFTMGSPASEPGRFDDETQREVTLTQGFYMGKYQVTQGQYQAVMGNNPSNYKTPVSPETSTENRPVEQVKWYDTLIFCNRLSMQEGLEPAYLINGSTDPSAWGDVPVADRNAVWDAVQIVAGSTGYRLPTEAQWEYACRAGTVAAFNWGTDYIDSTQANYNTSTVDPNNTVAETRLGRTTEVGSYAPNAWGLYDMHGNVSELCWDWYGSYSGGTQTDPTGAVSGDARVRRGSSGFGRYVRSAYRDSIIPNGRNLSTGFRLMRP
jgi:formylglycine-generating enzyme required for sulfatase activity